MKKLYSDEDIRDSEVALANQSLTSFQSAIIMQYIIDLEQEIDRLNNIINELEKWLNEKWKKPLAQIYVSDVVKEINKLKELRGNSK